MSNIEQARQIIKASFEPLFSKVKKYGLKKSIENIFPGLNVENFILKTLRNSLRLIKSVELGNSLGKLNIYYKSNAINIDCVGLISIFISKIIVSDEKIIKSLNDIFSQIEENFIRDEEFLLNKINKVLIKLTEKEFVTTSDFGEKSLYDLVLCILFNYYYSAEVEFPEWLTIALKKVDEVSFANDFMDFLSDTLINTLNSLSKSVYINYDIIFDSKILKFLLNRKTKNGQIAYLLKIFKLDFKKIISDFKNKYVGEAFLKGLGEHLVSIVRNLMFDVSEGMNNNYENRFNLTISLGNTPLSRRFRWFGTIDVDEFLEISENPNFANSVMVKAQRESVRLSRPTKFDFGTVAKYQIENKNKYSLSLNNFKTDKEYFIRVRRSLGNYENSFIIKDCKNLSFIVMSDSQGMTKEDYDIFIKVFQKIYEKFDFKFVAHLGDFVDDGSNENYWDFILNSPIWGKIPVCPIAGNHEAKFHPTLDFSGVQNSIVNHFNVELHNQATNKGIYYSFERDDCLFVFTNTNINGGLGKEQLKWIDSVFETSKAQWSILFTHKSTYSNGPHCNDENIRILRQQINEICLKYHVNLVIGGHDHVYSRSKPMILGIETDELEDKENNTFINLIGTIFVTLGPVGVKNYKICKNISVQNEVFLNLEEPSFSSINVTNNELNVEVIKFSKNEEFTVIDKFKILKDSKLLNQRSYIEKEIKNLPIVPWISLKLRLSKINGKYSSLNGKNKIGTIFEKKLNSALQYDKSYRRINIGNVSIIFNKSEFYKSLKDKSVRTIIIKCDIIKFENKFGFGRFVKIDRDILIKGDAKLKFVTFIVKKGVNFHIGGKIIIDNNRKKFSLFPPICSFILHNESSLILKDDMWVEQYSDLIKRDIIKIRKNARVFINSNNLKKLPDDFVSEDKKDCIEILK